MAKARMGLAGLLFVCLFAVLATAQECPCTEKAPDNEFTCEQQKGFGQCEADWMIAGGFCSCACGRCTQTAEKEPELVLEENLPAKPTAPAAAAPPKKPTPSAAGAEKGKNATTEAKVVAPAAPPSASLKPLRKIASKKCTKSVADIVTAAKELTVFSALLSATEAFETLHETKAKFTIFAPTDEAFEELGVDVADLLEQQDLVAALVGYHMVPEILTTEMLAKPAKIATSAGVDLFGGSSTEIEGLGSSARIIGNPYGVCNSVIYLIDEVLLPAKTLNEVGKAEEPAQKATAAPPAQKKVKCNKDFDAFFAISSDEELSMLTEAMNAAQLSGGVADPKNKYTILAPTNAAFKSTLQLIGLTFEALLKDLDTLTGILKYHMIEGNIEGDKFEEGTLVTMNKTTLFVEVDWGVEFAGTGTSARTVETDIDLACGSAVHKVDAVLLPYKIQGTAVVSSTSGTVVHETKAKSMSTTKSKSKPKSKPKAGTSAVATKKAAEQTCKLGTFSAYEVMSQSPMLKVFTQVIQLANMISVLAEKDLKVTIFAPVDYAFGNLLPEGKGFFDLVPDEAIAETLVSYHIAGVPVLSRFLKDGIKADTKLSIKGKPLKLEIIEDPLSPTNLAVKSAVSTANIIKTDVIGCNSVIHIVDAVLLPSPRLLPSKTVPLRASLDTAAQYQSLLKVPEIENKNN